MSAGYTIHLTIRGRVQGVFYRASARDSARQLGVDGWVRNLPDGAVEALVRGDADDVAKFVSWCRRGPRSARVDTIDERPTTEDEILSLAPGFRVLR